MKDNLNQENFHSFIPYLIDSNIYQLIYFTYYSP